MRQWMCNPLILCQKHLGGEHVESHMFVGILKKKLRIDGYIKNNLIEPISLHARHDILAWEMIRRRIIKGKSPDLPHKSPIDFDELFDNMEYLSGEYINYKINKENSLNDLLNRCLKCRSRFLLLRKYNLDPFDSYYLPPNVNKYPGL